MMLLNPKKAASVIFSKVSSNVDPKKALVAASQSMKSESDESLDVEGALMAACSAFVDAVHAKDVAGSAAAFKEMVKACGSMPEEEASDEDDFGMDSY